MNKLFPSEIKTKLLGLVFVLGLIYLILPGPTKIEDFPPLEPSLKSTLEGDTIQNPNIAAYFSDFRRAEITSFYRSQFTNLNWIGRIFPPLTLNHPPEYAYQYIRDQQESTFLEEYYYPFRESFFVNGYEPEVENQIYSRPSSFEGNHIIVRENGVGEEILFNSKATIRFYPNNILSRVLVYLSVWLSGILVYRLFKKALKE